MEESIKQMELEQEKLLKLSEEKSSLAPSQYSPLVLAYMGDAVYELVIRSRVVKEVNMQVNKMHKKTTQLVKAQTQARMIMVLEEELTPEEHAVYKRGRNAKSATMAKNATMKEYRMATGFEALMGYLYLNGELQRMIELIEHGLTVIKTEEDIKKGQ